MIEMESFFRDLYILPIICMSVNIFTVGGHSDAFGDVTVMDEEALSSVSSSLALAPWFSPEMSWLLGDFGERWPIPRFSMPFSETAGGWSNGRVFDIRDSPSWKISSKKQWWVSFYITKFETYYITLIAVRSISMALFNILFIYLN